VGALHAADIFAQEIVSPMLELGAYEALWLDSSTTFKSLSALLSGDFAGLPSQHVVGEVALERAQQVLKKFEQKNALDSRLILKGTYDYPSGLSDAKYPIQAFYYRGNLDLLNSTKRVAVVGSRNPSPEGLERSRFLARKLTHDGVLVFSGLARGIDTAAHSGAIAAGGNTVAVIGTPVCDAYPQENIDLQNSIATGHLLISQVPVLRYGEQSYLSNRFFFPERNATMSALTQATVIVEAGETSGSLIQARAALDQGRLLYIMESCFNHGLAWPEKFVARGAIRVKTYSDFKDHFDHATSQD
jgi:DNA processing protein